MLQKNKIVTLKVTYDSYDDVHYIVCPECGDYITIIPNTRCVCSCNHYWKIAVAAVGKLYTSPPQIDE